MQHSTVHIQEQPIAGLVVYWTASDCVYSDLAAAFKAAGLARCMEPARSPIVALRTALTKQTSFLPGIELKPLKGYSGIEVVQVTRRTAKQGGNIYTPILHAFFEELDGRLSQVPRFIWKQIEHIPIGSIKEIEARYAHELRLLGKHKVSRCLARVVDHLWGTPFRAKGAVYWLPADRLDQWEAAAQAVTASAVEGGHPTLHAMKIVHDPASVAAVTAAVAEEVARDAARLSEGLSDTRTTVAVVQARMKAADELLTRVSHYEKCLGSSLQAVRDQLETVKDAAAVAVLMAAAGGAK